jgi:hypothetical protein
MKNCKKWIKGLIKLSLFTLVLFVYGCEKSDPNWDVQKDTNWWVNFINTSYQTGFPNIASLYSASGSKLSTDSTNIPNGYAAFSISATFVENGDGTVVHNTFTSYQSYNTAFQGINSSGYILLKPSVAFDAMSIAFDTVRVYYVDNSGNWYGWIGYGPTLSTSASGAYQVSDAGVDNDLNGLYVFNWSNTTFSQYPIHVDASDLTPLTTTDSKLLKLHKKVG